MAFPGAPQLSAQLVGYPFQVVTQSSRKLEVIHLAFWNQIRTLAREIADRTIARAEPHAYRAKGASQSEVKPGTPLTAVRMNAR